MIRRVVAWRRCCSGRGLELRYSTGRLAARRFGGEPNVRPDPTVKPRADDLAVLYEKFGEDLREHLRGALIDTPRGPAYTVRGVEELNRMANAADTPPTPHTTIPGQEPPPEHGPRRP